MSTPPNQNHEIISRTVIDVCFNLTDVGLIIGTYDNGLCSHVLCPEGLGWIATIFVKKV